MSQIKHHHINIALFVFYIVAMTALMIWQGIGIAPDRYAFVLFFGALLVGRTRAFLIDWLPFLFILLSYDFLRGFADNLDPRVHYLEMINFDKFLFSGSIPTIYLQQIFYHPGKISLLDLLTTVFYFLHFALPLGFGFILWLNNRTQFRKFIIALTFLSYGAFFTYIVFPAAPPWMASEQKYIPEVHKIINSTLSIFPDKLHLPTVYGAFNPNPVAAIPSLHAAYPFLVFLFLLTFYGFRGILFLPYVLSVWFSVVYLGEHYVTDVLVGAIYAFIFYALTISLYKYFPRKLLNLSWTKPG